MRRIKNNSFNNYQYERQPFLGFLRLLKCRLLYLSSMMRIISLFFFLSSTVLYSQFTVTLMGEVQLDGKGLENCHVANKNTGDATITDRGGSFFINASEGDMITFTHISAQKKNVFLTKQHIKSSVLAVNLEQASNELKEVTLSINTKITAASVGLLNAGKPIPTTNERRLAAAGDFKPIDLLDIVLKMKLDIVPILNAINGRTARIKKHIEVDKEIAVNEILVWYYEEWLRERLEMIEDETLQFMDYLTDDDGIARLLEENSTAKVQIYLLDQYEAFQKIKNNTTPLPEARDGGF